MNIKFEIINGQLCRMVKPEPLQLDSHMPCVVRLIQDETPMGLYHKDLFRVDKDEYSPKICDEVRDIKDLSDSNRGSVIHSDGIISAQYYHFEIIGYPVEDGSHYWALYQMMQGYIVKNSNGIVPFMLMEDRIVRIDYSLSWDIEHWLRIFGDTTGWQLYEPEPEPQTEPCEICGGIGMISCEACDATGRVPIKPEPEPAYAVGDWVEFNPGNNPKQVKIVEIDGDKLYYNTRYAGKTIKTHIYASAITRKLKPSEVIVHIGCLSGTVQRRSYFDTDKFFSLKNPEMEMAAAVINIDALDTPTRELVKRLLKAQEE